MDKLPDYVSVKDLQDQPVVLRVPAQTLSFPLSETDKEIISILEAKFDVEKNCAGLAAPQIGYNKRVIVFAVNYSDDLKKWRPDLTDTMPKTIWINPVYEPAGEETHEDYEGCFSVENMCGPVYRYKQIRYQAFTPDGSEVKGLASGFLARLIQHEIDHLNGKLFIDLVPEGHIKTLDDYRKMREDRVREGGDSPEKK